MDCPNFNKGLKMAFGPLGVKLIDFCVQGDYLLKIIYSQIVWIQVYEFL